MEDVKERIYAPIVKTTVKTLLQPHLDAYITRIMELSTCDGLRSRKSRWRHRVSCTSASVQHRKAALRRRREAKDGKIGKPCRRRSRVVGPCRRAVSSAAPCRRRRRVVVGRRNQLSGGHNHSETSVSRVLMLTCETSSTLRAGATSGRMTTVPMRHSSYLHTPVSAEAAPSGA